MQSWSSFKLILHAVLLTSKDRMEVNITLNNYVQFIYFENARKSSFYYYSVFPL